MLRADAIHKAFRFAQQNQLSGYYAEFGVWQGESMGNAYANWEKIERFCDEKNKDSRSDIKGFVGYDSFEGLPAFSSGDDLDGYTIFHEGKFADTNYEILCEDLPFARLVKGYFSDTFPKEKPYPIAIAHIDCDIYSSTKEVLEFLDDRLIDGAVLLFDDWFCYRGRKDKGERRAFLEWKHKDNCQEYFNYAIQGKAMVFNR